jgi:hypothetical protein
MPSPKSFDSELWMADLKAGSLERLTADNTTESEPAVSPSELFPAWPPVGEEYAYVTDHSGGSEIWIRSRRNNWERALITPKDFSKNPPSQFFTPEYSPDGAALAFAATGNHQVASIWIAYATIIHGEPATCMKDALRAGRRRAIGSFAVTRGKDSSWFRRMDPDRRSFRISSTSAVRGLPMGRRFTVSHGRRKARGFSR